MTDLHIWLEKYAEHVWTDEAPDSTQVIFAKFHIGTVLNLAIKANGKVLASYHIPTKEAHQIPVEDVPGLMAWLNEDWGEE